MPTFLSHALVGVAAGKASARRSPPVRFWVLSAVVPALADLDVAAFALGIPYGHFFGHRGFFHSLFFAVVLGVCTTAFLFKEARWFPGRRFGLAAYFSLIGMTHPLLDAMTSGGLGIALLSPFDSTRYFFGWTPIQVAPIGIRAFFSEWGLRVLLSEALWVWLPTGVLLLAVLLIRRWAGKESRRIRSSSTGSGRP